MIARGGSAGFEAYTDNSGATATITVDHSNWLGGSKIGTKASIVDGGGNQSTAPSFVNAAWGDYHQAAGSPTIDAGLDETINGEFDVDGDPRGLFGTDIGADEFVVAPVAITGAAAAVTDRSASLTGSVDANGAPSTYHFEYGPTTAYGSVTPIADAGAGGAVAPTAAVGALSPVTTPLPACGRQRRRRHQGSRPDLHHLRDFGDGPAGREAGLRRSQAGVDQAELWREVRRADAAVPGRDGGPLLGPHEADRPISHAGTGAVLDAGGRARR